ncbi:hypothetical protein IFM89_005074 [Coptis chinensis]|uniref:P-type ATPase A domain-containing protein n=1 Tax=Coptis chinensis TaxID=261450 RepID=A0A835LMC7_9MAGN|nr:hypothetical protein IFM89_005074 [Coptis chinensis]
MEASFFSFGNRLLTCSSSKRRKRTFLSPQKPKRIILSFKPISFSPLLSSKPIAHLQHNSFQCSATHDHHHAHHHHGHGEGGGGKLNTSQEAILSFAKSTGWFDLSNFLREHLHLCCCSTALLLAAAVSPYLIAKQAVVKPIQNFFIAIAFPLVGVSAALDAVVDIAAGKVNIHVLMALAAFASVFMGNALEGGLLLAMFNLAHIAEEYFTSRAMVDVKELKENYPDFALVLKVNSDESPHFSDLVYDKVPVHDIDMGSYILVRAGESVPVDGEVCQGRSTITIEHLTGEAKPLETKVGDRLPGGARNLDGMMIVKATRTWKNSTLSKIVQLTEEAHLNKPKLQRWLDEFGEQYSKVVIVLSLAVALFGPFLFKWPFIGTSACRGSVYRALGLMVAASPCALAVAPLAYATAISACASKYFFSYRAVVDHSIGKDLPSVSVESFESLPGRGLLATLSGIEVTLFHFEDKPRPGVTDVIAALKNQAKLRVMMLTGDHESSAWRVGNAVGIKEVYCSLKPEDKLNQVKNISRDSGGGLIMVGDGINDAPALAAATVGIVLAQRASATAIAVADVLLLQDNISGVPFCIAKARQTTSLVKQSVVLALSCIAFASLPSVLGFLPLWLTVLLHEGGTLLVCLNSIRALNNPTWSWRQDLQRMLDQLKSCLAMFLKRPPTSSTIQTAS